PGAAPTRMRRSSDEKPGDMAAPEPSGVSAVNVRPSSVETWSAAGPATKMRESSGYAGGSRTWPPANPAAGRRVHVLPASVDRNRAGHTTALQPRAATPEA